MVKRYEALVLTVPTITQDEAKNLENQVARLVADHKGSLVSFERWGKYRLAYEIRKNDYGVYFLTRFEAEKPHALLEDLKHLFAVKLNDLIMRDMVTVLNPKGSLAYNRPQSLDEIPVRESYVSDRTESAEDMSEEELEIEKD